MILVLDDEVQPEYRYHAPEIARLLPEADYHVYPEDTGVPPLERYDGVVISGSTAGVYENEPWMREQMKLVRELLERGMPTLGVCFGHQLVNAALGGEVVADERRATFVEMEQLVADDVLAGVEPPVPALHGDVVTERGEGMERIARTAYSENFCTRHESAPVWTVQFHPEFTPEITDRVEDWSPGAYDWADCTADRALENFARTVRAATAR
jgi:GMP synthase (glutamine-hydrolysing)